MNMLKKALLFSVVLFLSNITPKIMASAPSQSAEERAKKVDATILAFTLKSKERAEQALLTLPAKINEMRRKLNAMDRRLSIWDRWSEPAISSGARPKEVQAYGLECEKLKYEREELQFQLTAQEKYLAKCQTDIIDINDALAKREQTKQEEPK